MSGYEGNHHLYNMIHGRPSVIRHSDREDDHAGDHRMIPPDLDLNIDWASEPSLVTKHSSHHSDHYHPHHPSDHYRDNSAPKRRKTEAGGFHEIAVSSDQTQLSDSLLFSPGKVRHRKLSESSSSSTSTNVANSPKVSMTL